LGLGTGANALLDIHSFDPGMTEGKVNICGCKVAEPEPRTLDQEVATFKNTNTE
jgi:hypothetical protein